MKILERKKVELQFVDVKVSLKVDLAALSTEILFDSSDDADNVYDVLSNKETFDGCYNIVDKVSSKIIRLTGEIVVKFLHTNTLVVTVYKNWEEL
ncbi:MAG: hypothetical protein MSS76_01445 [Clostridium sp.]|nr:hypothetical protein [Clostridium sp.]